MSQESSIKDKPVENAQVYPEQQANIKIKDNKSYLETSSTKAKAKQKMQNISESIAESQIEDSTQDISPKQKSPSQRGSINNREGKNKVKSRLQDIQCEKQKIMSSLKEVNQEIASIKGQVRPSSQLHKRELIAENPEAQRNAIELVKYYRQRKRELEEKKKSQTCKIMVGLRQQQAETQKRHAEQQQARRQEKRDAISQRLNEAKLNREKGKAIKRQTNMFISKLLKDEKDLQRQQIDLLRQASERRMHFIERRPKQSHRRPQQHQVSRLVAVSQESRGGKQRSASINHPIRKYKKTKWSEQIQDLEQREREVKLIRQINKQNGRRKRLKYGELVVSLFSQRRRALTLPNPEERTGSLSMAQNSQSVYLPLPIAVNHQITEENTINRQTQSFKTSPPRNSRIFKSQQIEKLTPEQLQLQSKKRAKERQLRKQTKERLKRIGTESQREPQRKYQSNYQNYLGMFKAKKHNGPESWNKILSSQLTSKEEKYEKMIREAESLENRARLKEEVFRKGGEETDELFMESIQAKLMILQRM